MIDIRDLTIGNWVFDGIHTNFPMQITSLSEGYVTMSFPSNEGMDWESTPEELQGIPLTEDLLSKLGFTHNGYGIWNKRQQDRKIAINVKAEFLAIDAYKDRYCDSRCTCHGIKYLHQLQNLFYVIAKEELKFDL